jgi:WXG100 family type VII secretion target
MSRFEVDSARVAEASAAVKGSVVAINAEVDRMMRNLMDLQGSWRGQASDQFQFVANDWRATQERVRQSLEGINAALMSAANADADVEQHNLRMFGR